MRRGLDRGAREPLPPRRPVFLGEVLFVGAGRWCRSNGRSTPWSAKMCPPRGIPTHASAPTEIFVSTSPRIRDENRHVSSARPRICGQKCPVMPLHRPISR
jgi:hypothetical protein